MALVATLVGVSMPVAHAAQAHAKEEVACSASAALVRLIANSDLILTGSLALPEGVRAALGREGSGVVLLSFVKEEIIKGRVGPMSMRVAYDPRPVPSQPSPERVLSSSGRPSLIFLTEVGAGGYYFAGGTPEAIQHATPDAVEAAKQEVMRQQRLLRGWKPDLTTPHFLKVRRLVARLGRGSADDEARVYRRLEALGSPAVPAIVAHMDDRRSLRRGSISLANRAPGSFEGLRHYRPKLVVDALAAVLAQITGRSFGFIENGGTNEERQKVVAGWRVYAASLDCEGR